MYEELVKILRVCGDSNNSCGNCPVREDDGSCPHGEWDFVAEKYMLKAADAIEELQNKVDRAIGFWDSLEIAKAMRELSDAMPNITDPNWQKVHMDMGFYSPIGEVYKDLGFYDEPPKEETE